MSKRLIVVVAVVAGTIVSSIALSAGGEREAIITALGEQEYFDCGLDKLEKQERGNLFRLMGAYPTVSYTQSAAEAYLRREGWRPIHVLGAVLVDSIFDERHIIVADNYKLYQLDPGIVPYLPDPGVYWAYGTARAWKIIYPDGDEGGFWATELD
jgi:hypothetical protein